MKGYCAPVTWVYREMKGLLYPCNMGYHTDTVRDERVLFPCNTNRGCHTVIERDEGVLYPCNMGFQRER